MFIATAHGLRIACDFPVPDFDPSTDGPIDITIVQSGLDENWVWENQRDGWINATDAGQRVRIDVADCASFLVTNGKTIQYAPVANPVGGDARLKAYLLGRVLSAALYQRLRFPLHASCVEMNGAAWVFAGESGVGKSTLCQYLTERGNGLVADDVVCLEIVENGAVAWPGIRRTKLWSESLEWFGMSSEGLDPVEEQIGKFHVKREGKAMEGAIPVRGVVLLETYSEISKPSFTALTRIEALQAISQHNYLWPFIPVLGLGDDFLEYAIGVQKTVPFFRLERPKGLDHLSSVESALATLQTAISR